MKRLALVLLLASSLLATSTPAAPPRFECTRRPGDWGLFKTQAAGPELIACFGGMFKSEDDEMLCRAALKHGDVGPGRYYCAPF